VSQYRRSETTPGGIVARSLGVFELDGRDVAESLSVARYTVAIQRATGAPTGRVTGVCVAASDSDPSTASTKGDGPKKGFTVELDPWSLTPK
jgi:hypothetical protein